MYLFCHVCHYKVTSIVKAHRLISTKKCKNYKRAKYNTLKAQLGALYKVDEVGIRVEGLAVGCRGVWVPRNTRVLKSLGMGHQRVVSKLCNLALVGTISLERAFMLQ